MPGRTFYIQIVVVAAVAASVPTVAVAQDDEAIDEIQVTATRRPAATSDVSAAVTLISEEDIRSLKLTTDALAAQPGVFLQQTTPGQGAAIVRGLKGSEVLHIVDGFRLNNAIFRNAPTQYLALVSPGTVERIEVLRGSPASLYGSDAVGGVLQVISRMPAFDSAEFGWRREFGFTIDSAELQRSLHASVDAGTDRVAGLLSLDYLETGDRKVGGGDRIAPSGYESRSARAALRFTPDEDSEWIFDAHYGRQPRTPRIDELVPGFGETEPGSEEFFFAPNERSFLHLKYTRHNGWFDADWNVDLGWQQIVDDRVSRNFGSDSRRIEQNSSDLFGISITLNDEFDRGSWVAGVEFYDDEVESRRDTVDIVTGEEQSVQSRFPDGSAMDQAAAFGNLHFDLSERQTISGGLRFSIVNVDLAATQFSPAATVDLDDWSADLGWSFELNDSAQLVANLGYGFRAPNVFDLGTLGERPGNRFNIPNPALSSEHIIQFDVGVRWSGERSNAELVVWVLEYDDRITSVLTGAVTPDGRDVVQTQNRANARIHGFEGIASVALGERAVAELILNYVHGELDDADGLTEPGDRIPPLNGRLGVDFAWSETLTLRPFVIFASDQDRLSARDVRDPRIDPEGTSDWVTLNIDASWQPDENWSVRMGALNLFDENYRVHGSGIDAPGRNLVLNVRYLW